MTSEKLLWLTWTTLLPSTPLSGCKETSNQAMKGSDLGVQCDVNLTHVFVVQALDLAPSTTPNTSIVDASTERASIAELVIHTPKQSGLTFGGSLEISGAVQEMLPIGLPELLIKARHKDGTVLVTGEMADDGTFYIATIRQ